MQDKRNGCLLGVIWHLAGLLVVLTRTLIILTLCLMNKQHQSKALSGTWAVPCQLVIHEHVPHTGVTIKRPPQHVCSQA